MLAWFSRAPYEVLRVSVTAAVSLFSLLTALRADPTEVVIPPAQGGVLPLTAQEQKRVKKAIEGGIDYLRRTQLATGSWVPGGPDVKLDEYSVKSYAAGFASLGGLALLECGVPADDHAVQKAAALVRKVGPDLFRTYDVTLSVLFLDRLDDANDRPLLRSLALRLAAGQTDLGGWAYNCPLLSKADEKRLEQALAKKTRADLPQRLQPRPLPRGKQDEFVDPADNSNTQFAILALAAARRHGLPLDFTVARMEQRFRLSERANGWEYHWIADRPARAYGSMTCVGLLGLAVGRAAAEQGPALSGKDTPTRAEDEGVSWGLKVLGAYLRDPSDFRSLVGGGPAVGKRRLPNQYFLWSVERVGVLCGVETIGGIDWYRWGAGPLVATQRRDGSWLGRGSGGYPVADTCFALLFLRRSDLLPDVRKELAKRVKIVDHGPLTKEELLKKVQAEANGKSSTELLPTLKALFPDEKSKPGRKGQSHAENLPESKKTAGNSAAREDGPLTADLGDVKAGQSISLPLRVRGPAAFRITGIRGGDERLKIQSDSQNSDVHDLTVSVRLDQAGLFERTLQLQTDLPGRAEVAVRVRLRVTAVPGEKR
jgi:hypothetical protein